MKTVITIENGKITLQVDDEPQIHVSRTVNKLLDLDKPLPTSTHKLSPGGNPDNRPSSCGYCIKRGAPCVRHGGERSGVYTAKKHRAKPNAAQRAWNGSPEPTQPVETKPPTPNEDFDNPWNCLMCENAGDLCVMHQKMTDNGQTPPAKTPQTEIRS